MQIYKLVDELVASGESIKRPATSPAVAGKWRLRWSEQVRTPACTGFQIGICLRSITLACHPVPRNAPEWPLYPLGSNWRRP